MLQGLTEKLGRTISRLRGKGRLNERDVDEALRDIRLTLLEADVNFRAAGDFTERVRARIVGKEILGSFNPGQQVMLAVYEEMANLLGGENQPLSFSENPPTVILLMGLQGTGKTTTAGKLSKWVQGQGMNPLLVACDIRRPAAVAQLQQLGEQIGVEVFQMGTRHRPEDIARAGLSHADSIGANVVIVDTGGRLQTDEQLMEEVRALKNVLQPDETLLVVDAMSGQDAVNSALEFDKAVDVSGFIVTKVDSDARGGAVLSVRAVTGKPIKFVATGEHPSELDVFHPERFARRILGAGDVETLIEKAELVVDENKAEELEKRVVDGTFGLDDMLDQFKQMRKIGPLDQIARLLPGMGGLGQQVSVDEKQMSRTEAIVLSMTVDERRNPNLIDGSRKRRIARGSGAKVQQVNQLLKQFRVMKKMMQQVAQSNPSESDMMRMIGMK